MKDEDDFCCSSSWPVGERYELIQLKGCRPIMRKHDGPFFRSIPPAEGPYCVLDYHRFVPLPVA